MRKREFDIDGYHFKLDPTTRGGFSVNGQKAKYDIVLITNEQDCTQTHAFVGTCRTLSEGFVIASHYVNDIKAGNNEVSVEKALEAYNTIREYCGRHIRCNGCLFHMDGSNDVSVHGCLFSYQGKWLDLDLN